MLSLLKKSFLQTLNINAVGLGILLQIILFIYWNLLGRGLFQFLKEISLHNVVVGDSLPMLYFYAQQSAFWISFLILSAVALLFTIIIYFAYANYANGKGFWESIGIALKKIKHSAALVAVLFSLQTMLFGLNIIFLNLFGGFFATLVVLIFVLIILYGFLRFSLIIPILALERRRVKKGLQKAWLLSKGNTTKIFTIFLASLALGVLIYIIGDFLAWIYAIAGLDFYIESLGIDLTIELTDVLLNAIMIGFVPIALTNFYLKKAKLKF